MLKLSEATTTAYDLGTVQSLRVNGTTTYLDVTAETLVAVRIFIGASVTNGNTLTFKVYGESTGSILFPNHTVSYTSDGNSSILVIPNIIPNTRLAITAISDEAGGADASVNIQCVAYEQNDLDSIKGTGWDSTKNTLHKIWKKCGGRY